MYFFEQAGHLVVALPAERRRVRQAPRPQVRSAFGGPRAAPRQEELTRRRALLLKRQDLGAYTLLAEARVRIPRSGRVCTTGLQLKYRTLPVLGVRSHGTECVSA